MFRLRRTAKAFAADRSGAIGVMFGMVFVPLIAIVGLAIDYGRASHAHSTLQTAADNAAQSVIGKIDLPWSELKPQIRSALNSNLPAHMHDIDFAMRVDQLGGTIDIDIDTKFSTPMLAIIGKSEANIVVTGHARATRQEVVENKVKEEFAKRGKALPTIDPNANRRAAEILSQIAGKRVSVEDLTRAPSPEQMRQAEQALNELSRTLLRR